MYVIVCNKPSSEGDVVYYVVPVITIYVYEYACILIFIEHVVGCTLNRTACQEFFFVNFCFTTLTIATGKVTFLSPKINNNFQFQQWQ